MITYKEKDNSWKIDAKMRECRKRPVIVEAMEMNEMFRVESREGNYKQGKPGDFLMRGVQGELYICDREIFLQTYDFLDD